MKSFSDYNIDLGGKSGTQIRTSCPECTPSRKKKNTKDLSVNTVDNTWFCHHCEWKGGLNGKGKVYSMPEYTAQTILPQKVVKYFSDRGISEDTLLFHNIGYGPTWMPAADKEVNAIQFPFYKNSVVVNIKYRDGHKHFKQAKNAQKCFYGFDNMTNKTDTLIITEGEIDALSVYEAGFHEVVSMPDGAPSGNSTNFNTKFDFLISAEENIKKYKKVIIAVDGDGPGKVALDEISRRIGYEKSWYIVYPEWCKDSNDVLVKYGKEKLKELLKNPKGYPVDGLYEPNDFLQDVLSDLTNGVDIGAKTGWPGLDKYITFVPGELTIITGMPSSGKSNWNDCLALNLAEQGWKFGVYSAENQPVKKHMRSFIEKMTKKSFYKTYSGYDNVLKSDVVGVVEYLQGKFYFILPEEPTIDAIIERAKVALFRSGINALLIDPWNEIYHDFKGMTETQYISQALGKLRSFGRANDIHIFIVAHPAKQYKTDSGKYNAPDMYSIAGGAHFRNKADNGICVHRTYNEGEESEVQIIVQKVRYRDFGQPGMYKLRFEYATSRYVDDVKQENF